MSISQIQEMTTAVSTNPTEMQNQIEHLTTDYAHLRTKYNSVVFQLREHIRNLQERLRLVDKNFDEELIEVCYPDDPKNDEIWDMEAILQESDDFDAGKLETVSWETVKARLHAQN